MNPVISNHINYDHSRFLKSMDRLLFILLLLMIACFFTWSENVNITRAIKIFGRLGVLLGSYYAYQKVIKYGAVDTLKWHNSGAPLLYCAYLFLGLCSFLWTSDIGVSALQWFMTTQTFVFGYFFIKTLYLLDAYFPNHHVRLYNLLGNTIFLILLIFIIGMWVDPDTFYRKTNGGEEARLGGYMMNPNELGMLSGLGVASLIFDLYRNHQKWWTLFKILLLFYVLYATGSRSSLIGAFLIIGFHIKQASNVKLKLATISALLVIMPIAVNKIILKDGDSSRMEEVMSMTGRLPFWTALINEGLPREPLLGFGFMRIDYKDYFQSTHTYPGKMTHNTFLQVLMNLGFVGLTIVLFQMYFTLKGISREEKEKRWMLFCMLIPLIINSATEFGIFGESNYGILFYQLIVLYISFKQHPVLSLPNRIYLMKKRPDLGVSI